MYDTQITLAGWIGGEVTLREVGQDRHVASFRVACTPTRYRDGEWVKGTTSLHSGDPVVVHGRLVADVWERDGKPQTSWEVVATSVGHDLSHGTTRFTKPVPVADRPAEVVHAPAEVEPVTVPGGVEPRAA